MSAPRRAPLASARQGVIALSTLLVGAAGLAFALRLPADSAALIPLMLMIAAVWVVGALMCAQPGSLSRPSPRSVLLWLGAGIAGAALGAALADALHGMGTLAAPLDELARLADTPTTGWVVVATVANGIGEEMFFRGSLADLTPRNQRFLSPAAYVAVTATTGNLVLVAASVVMALVATAARRTTGSAWASAAFHCGFTVPLIWVLPQIVPAS